MEIFSIVFLTGTDKHLVLESLIHGKDKLLGLVLPYSSQREDRLQTMIAMAQKHDIPILRPKRTELAEVLNKIKPDILLSAGYPYILDAEVLKIARYSINIHPTLLPRYRGPATAWHVIAYGEQESGVTIHFMDEKMDTGPIIHQMKVPLTKFDTVWSLMRKTTAAEPAALSAALDRLKRDDFVPVIQDEQFASTFLERRGPEDSRIDPEKSINELYNFIRACDPDRFPAFFEVDGQKVGIRLFRLNRPEDEGDLI